MKIKNILQTLLLLIIFGLTSHAQILDNDLQSSSKKIEYDINGNVKFLIFHESISKSIEEVEKLWLSIYQLDESFIFKQKNIFTDQLGISHAKYQLYFENIEVEGSELIIHSTAQRVISFNGHVYIPKKQEAKLDAKESVIFAIEAYPSNHYKFNDSIEEQHIRTMNQDSNATYYPKPKLVYIPKDLNFKQSEWGLCYKMDLYSDAPLFRKWVYINAINGELYAFEDRICHANSDGTAKTRYSGTQKIKTDSLSTTNYRLRETTRGKGIETYNMQNGSKYGAAVDFTDSDNIWDNVNSKQNEIATDAHWGAEKTWDYFWNVHARNSFDGNGAKIRSFVHYGNRYNNAFWNGSVMTYGDGDSSRFYPLTSLDVCGHEVTHAVTTNSANLVYRYESGALNESFSDIFGQAIESFAKPSTANWAIGEDITPNKTGIRNMKNPNSKGHPDTYKGKLWRTGAADNGGVHSNSGVQNYWFYLLCHGGVGVNDNSEIFKVDSIGISKAERIAYRNLTVYLTRSSEYDEARLYAIQSAQDIFGYCSKELIATTNAWHAVGVGTKYDSLELEIAFTGDSSYCHPPAQVQFENRSVNAKNYDWDFGDGKSSNLASPSHTYNSYGTFSVKLVGEGCYNGQKDSFEKTAWIVVDSNFDICNSYIMPYRSWDSVYDCKGMIYDNGGEKEYLTLVRDTFTVNTVNSDSIRIKFLDFDYENKYDYVYLYAGKTPKSPRIGAYTGQTLPNGGADIILKSKSFTIVHFSDPLVVGRGFKLEFEAFRSPLTLKMPNDTTFCMGDSVWIVPEVSGPVDSDFEFEWSNGATTDSIYFSTLTDTTLYLRFYDACTDQELIDSIKISVLDPLELSTISDTTICYNQIINLVGNPSGGLNAGHQVNWSFGVVGNSVNFNSSTDTMVYAILSDACTALNDTNFINIKVRDSLEAEITKDTLMCNGQSVDIEAIGKGGRVPYSYFWDNGLGAGSKKNVSPVLETTYTVNVSDGCSPVNGLASVTVSVRNQLQLQMSNDTVLCRGNLVDLNAIASGGLSTAYDYTWNEGLPKLASHQVKPDTTTTYKVTLEDNCSSKSIEDSIVVTVLDSLQVSINGKDTVCYGENTILTAIGTGGNINNHFLTWNNGLGVGANVNINPTNDITVQVVLSDGCTVKSDTATKRIVVREPLKVTLQPQTASICEGDSLEVSASGIGGIKNQYIFQWDQGLGLGQTVKISPKFDTKYTVVLTDNCSNFVDTSIDIKVLPKPNINLEIFPNPQCVGQEITFKNNTVNKAAHQFKWDFGDGTTSNQSDLTHSYKKEGFYDVKLWAINADNCSDSMVLPNGIEIQIAPISNFTYSPVEINILEPLVSFANSSSNSSIYSWNFGDGTGSTDENPNHTYTETGEYFVTLISENAIGCQNSSVQRVIVRDVFQMYIPSAFSPSDNDQINPVLSVDSRGVAEFEIRIFNRWGELVFFSEDPDFVWDGKDKSGNIHPIGAYFYTARVVDVNREKYDLKGSINIIR